MKPGRLLIAAVLIAGSLGWVAYKGLRGNLVYYRTPTEILHQGRSAVGERVRLGGLVMPGSVERAGTTVRFVVTDETTRMTVIDSEGVPALFRGGKGVVLEGYYGADGAFHADTVLVKHNDRYSPPRPGETPHSANVGGG
ncbi:MAG TPA: cytochrome c maturation protein CcmE [Actinomycetota bacterium]|nr:cytochrome c maturation protein CcmE [Actinomycetota bacterium]